MRVIAGSARGTKLHCPEGLAVRPTHDRVKEAVFSMLGEQVSGAQVLDLFAGTGALGIEALSRGAAQAVFVDVSASSLKTVADNISKTRLTDKAQLIQSDFSTYLTDTEKTFDLIFLDPPYSRGYIEQALKSIADNALLTPNGIIYCELEDDLPPSLLRLYQILRDKKYGRAHVLLLKELSV
ncbi:MAG: 16S rRNA (guanine(966)-N(2))-methyltransferase RsmD [Ruminococcaceae bacterium]|nr:16S rRNA (guanine(966)-N(2))-methyltransferase RsmD [Oscillospiraceae bacterium]